MTWKFILILPNYEFQKIRLFIWILSVIFFILIVWYSIYYNYFKQKLLSNSIKNISIIPEQILNKVFEKDKNKLLTDESWDFIKQFVKFCMKWGIQPENLVKNLSKIDIKTLKQNLSVLTFDKVLSFKN